VDEMKEILSSKMNAVQSLMERLHQFNWTDRITNTHVFGGGGGDLWWSISGSRAWQQLQYFLLLLVNTTSSLFAFSVFLIVNLYKEARVTEWLL